MSGSRQPLPQQSSTWPTTGTQHKSRIGFVMSCWYDGPSEHKPEKETIDLKKERNHRYLSQTFLSCPHRRVDDLQEELSGSRVEDENGSIDGLCGQVTFKRLVRESG